MKKILILLFTIPFLMGEINFKQNQLLVKFSDNISESHLRIILKDTGLNPEKKLVQKINLWLISIDPDKYTSTDIGLEKIREYPEVIYAQLDHLIIKRETPNDPDFSQMWDMHNTGQNGGSVDADIDAPEAWDLTTGGVTALGDEIVVAVVDGGVDINHEDLIDNIWINQNEIPGNGIDDDNNGYVDDINGWDAYSNDGSIPSDNHGTHVAGTIGAKGNNGIDVVGVNWDVKIMAIAGSSGTTSTISIAYGYVLDQKALWLETNGEYGANVVATNSSFGIDYADCNSGQYPVWNDLYNSMGEVGILSAAATINGNQNVDVIGDVPTGCDSDWIISVTNTTRNDEKYSQAGYGATTIDLGAPGTDICSTISSNGVSCSYTGTSMATPHVAGAVGFLHAAASVNLAQVCIDDPGSCALTLKETLLENTDPLSSLDGTTVSGGRLNLYNAAFSISGPMPNLDYSPSLLEFNLDQDQIATETITITNTGEDDSQLIYSINSTPFENGGGPDLDDNYWGDSDNENSFNYDWIDISGIGSQYSFLDNDQAGESIVIGFDFPFYNNMYNELIINPNGWIGFGADNPEWDNTSIPSNNAPGPAIFGFWDDLNPVNDSCNEYCSGEVYYHSNAERLVVWFDEVAHWWTNNENSFYNFQIVLYPTGRVQLNYNSITGTHSSTIGMQNSSGTSGLMVSFNNDYIHDALSVRFSKTTNWLTLSSDNGELSDGESDDIIVSVDSSDLTAGEYSSFLNISSQGGSGIISVNMNISDLEVTPGDVNGDGLINVLDIVSTVNFIIDSEMPEPSEFAAADINGDNVINVLDIVLMINIILDS